MGGRQGCPAASPAHGGSRPIRDSCRGQGSQREDRIFVVSHGHAGQGEADQGEGPCAGLQGQEAGLGLDLSDIRVRNLGSVHSLFLSSCFWVLFVPSFPSKALGKYSKCCRVPGKTVLLSCGSGFLR